MSLPILCMNRYDLALPTCMPLYTSASGAEGCSESLAVGRGAHPRLMGASLFFHRRSSARSVTCCQRQCPCSWAPVQSLPVRTVPHHRNAYCHCCRRRCHCCCERHRGIRSAHPYYNCHRCRMHTRNLLPRLMDCCPMDLQRAVSLKLYSASQQASAGAASETCAAMSRSRINDRGLLPVASRS